MNIFLKIVRAGTTAVIFLLLIPALYACAGWSTVDVGKASATDATPTEPIIESSISGEDMSVAETEKNYLILVNKSNPLPEDYTFTPAEIESGFSLDADILPCAKAFINAGREAGFTLVVRSAYRSNAEQEAAFNEYVEDYLKKGRTQEEAEQLAAKWVQKPGCSEHQTGLCLDINPVADTDEKKTDAYTWLKYNCAEYGFILRYPAEKSEITGINKEPWHFRYVGKEVAQQIMSQDLTLEEYLGVTVTE